jgi:hypothetical protein
VPERIAAWIMEWLGKNDRDQGRPGKRCATPKRAQIIADKASGKG